MIVAWDYVETLRHMLKKLTPLTRPESIGLNEAWTYRYAATFLSSICLDVFFEEMRRKLSQDQSRSSFCFRASFVPKNDLYDFKYTIFNHDKN